MANITSAIQQGAESMAAGIRQFSNYSAKAASNANGVSATAQAAQGNFNAGQANLSNSIGSERIAEQYQYNAAQTALANQLNMDMWNRTAGWNEAMWDKQASWQEMMWEKAAAWNEMMQKRQMDFNSSEALKNRQWQQMMAETSYQRAVKDMSAAGLNPILAATGGGISTGSGGGSAASIGGTSMGAASTAGTSMSPLSSHSASGGLLNANMASEGNYQGQMEYMGGMLGLLSAGLNGLSTALSVMSNNKSLSDIIGEFMDEVRKPSNPNSIAGNIDRWKHRNDWKSSEDDAQYWNTKGWLQNRT